VAEHGEVVCGATVQLPAGACTQAGAGAAAAATAGDGPALTVNGVRLTTSGAAAGGGCVEGAGPAAVATVSLPPLRFGSGSAEAPPLFFPHAAALPLAAGPDAPDGNATFVGAVTVPAVVFEQLTARAAAYPVPWDARDEDASWLRPQRLLLFLQLNCTTGRAGACDDRMPAALRVDGAAAPLPPLKAYESRCTQCSNANHPLTPRRSARFNGYYWDVSAAFKAGVGHTVELRLPKAFKGALQGLYFEGVEPLVTGLVSQGPGEGPNGGMEYRCRWY
jgi:hypothetical protein